MSNRFDVIIREASQAGPDVAALTQRPVTGHDGLITAWIMSHAIPTEFLPVWLLSTSCSRVAKGYGELDVNGWTIGCACGIL